MPRGPEYVSQTRLATLIGVAPKTLTAWGKEAIPIPIAARGRGSRPHTYHVPSVVAWLLERAAVGRDRLELEQERARLAAHQADAQEMKNLSSRGELAPVEELADSLGRTILHCRTRLLGLPTELAPLVIGHRELPIVRDILDAGIRTALSELDPALVFAALDIPVPLGAAAETDSVAVG
jgi:hypothetical protein